MSHRIHFLNIRRDKFKSRITNFVKRLEENQISDKELIRKERDRLKELFQAFSNDQTEREQYENVKTVDAEGDSITEEYCSAITYANSILKSLQLSTDDVTLPGPSTSATNNEAFQLETTFNGNQREWSKFKEDFQRYLRENSGLSESRKLQMLRSNLSEKLKFAIDSVVGNEDNFNSAWKQLLEAYDDPHKFTMHHASQLLNMPAMPDDSLKSVQNLYTRIDSHVRWLEIATRSRHDIARILLVSLAVTKMGPETRRKYEQTLTVMDRPDINDILKYLERYIRLQTLADSSKLSNHIKPNTETQKSTLALAIPKMKRSMESSRSTCENRSMSPPMKSRRILPDTCKVCGRHSHGQYFCPQLRVWTVYDRRSAVRKAQLCELCLLQDHSTNSCRYSIRCKVCGGKHNTILHEDPNGPFTY